MASSCTYYVPKCGSTRLCDQNCGLQSEHRQTHTRTDKSLKTEGPMILSIYIFYFKTVIIGGPISAHPLFILLYSKYPFIFFEKINQTDNSFEKDCITVQTNFIIFKLKLQNPVIRICVW